MHLKNNILYLSITVFSTLSIFISGCSYFQDEKISDTNSAPIINLKTFDQPEIHKGFDNKQNLEYHLFQKLITKRS